MRWSSYHPLVNVLFFACVIAATVSFTHPAFVLAGVMSALIYMLKVRGRQGLRYVAGAVAAGVCWAVGFTATMHFGTTRLVGAVIGNPITLEALACGAVQGARLIGLLLWLNCLVAVLTADKVGYVLGRVSPRLSLAFALLLRAAPVLNERRRGVMQAIAGVYGSGARERPGFRLRLACRRAGAVLSWAIDRGFTVQFSLSSRGAQLKGRTAFSRYRFDTRDRTVVIVLVLLATLTGVGAALDQTVLVFDPELVAVPWTAASLFFLVCYMGLCLLPWLLQTVGEYRMARALRTVGEGDCD